MVALEGQGQDELFAALVGLDPAVGRHASKWTAAGSVHASGRCDRAGVAYVPGDRAEALLMQRSVRENIALPFSAALAQLGPDRHAKRARRGSTAPSSGCRSTRGRSARCSGFRAATSRR